MTRAAIAVSIGKLTSATATPHDDNPRESILFLRGEAGSLTIEVQTDDLWKIATTCRDSVKLCEMHRETARAKG